VLSEIEGMTGAEVARSLGLRPSTTYDAIRTLRRRFVEDVIDAPDRPRLQSMAKRDRPRATAQSWGALVAALPGSRIVGATGSGTIATWSSLSAVAKAGIATAAAATVLAGGMALGTARTSTPPATRDRPARTVASRDETPPIASQPPVPQAAAPLPPVAAAVNPPTNAAVPSEPVEARPGRPPRTTNPPAPVDPDPADGLGDENALLRGGTAALRNGDASRALRLADQHARAFPDSALADLRTALRIESLCALGNTAQARGESRQFLVRHPSSPLAERIEAACPRKSDPAPDNPNRSGHG